MLKTYFYPTLRIIVYSLVIDLLFLLMFISLNEFNQSFPWAQRIFVFVIIFAIAYIVFGTKLHRELKASLSVVPLQIIFLFLYFVFHFLMIQFDFNAGLLRAAVWFLTLILPLGTIGYLLWSKKHWYYIFGVFVALIPIFYIFFFQ